MSMLTAQCDKLRKRAAELRQGRWSDGADDAALMDDAADVIENLRDRLTDTETCRMTLCAAGNDYARYRCSECERETMVPHVVEGVSRDYERPRYCVNCGRKVVG